MSKSQRPPRAGVNLPPDAAPMRIQGVMHTRLTRFGLKIRVWPKKRTGPKSDVQLTAEANFRHMIELVKSVPSWDRAAAVFIAHGTGWTWRDVLSKAVTGSLWDAPDMQSAAIPFILDAISNIDGAMLYRTPAGWVGLVPAADGDVLVLTAGVPGWVAPSSLPSGIHQLTGDVTAGPGSGSVAAVLAASGVTAGVYHHASVTVDAKGRLTAAASGAVATLSAAGIVKPDGSTITIDIDGTIHGAASGLTQLTGDVTAGPASGSTAATLSNSGVTAGSYDHATITVDAKGRLTTAANGAVATSSVVGLVKPDGTSLTVDGAGKLSVPVATASVNGIVQPDNVTIAVNGSGALRALAGGGGGVGGLYAGVMSTLPTSAGTGLTTWTNQGAATVNDRLIGISLSSPSTVGNQLRMRTMTAPVTTPYSFRALVAVTAPDANFSMAGIGWTDGTKIQFIMIGWDGGQALTVRSYTNVTTFSANNFGSVLKTPNPLWLKIRDDGTNVTFGFSASGDDTDFQTVYTIAKSAGFLGATGYSNVAFIVNNSATGDNVIGTLMSFAQGA